MLKRWIPIFVLIVVITGCHPEQQLPVDEHWNFKRSEGHFREGDTVLVFQTALPSYSSLHLSNSGKVIRITTDTLSGYYERTDSTLLFLFSSSIFEYKIDYLTADSMILRLQYIPDSVEMVDYFSR